MDIAKQLSAVSEGHWQVRQGNERISFSTHPEQHKDAEPMKESGLPARKSKKRTGKGMKITIPMRCEDSSEHMIALIKLPQLKEYIDRLVNEIPEVDRDEPVEYDPHITVKWGIRPCGAEELKTVLAGTIPFEVKLGKTSCFSSTEAGQPYDVVKIEVNSKELMQLNLLLSEQLPHVDTHDRYRPHITVAYVRAGTGNRYADNQTLEGMKLMVRSVSFSSPNGEMKIPLRQIAEPEGPADSLADTEGSALPPEEAPKEPDPVEAEKPLETEDITGTGAIAAVPVGLGCDRPDGLPAKKRRGLARPKRQRADEDNIANVHDNVVGPRIPTISTGTSRRGGPVYSFEDTNPIAKRAKALALHVATVAKEHNERAIDMLGVEIAQWADGDIAVLEDAGSVVSVFYPVYGAMVDYVEST